MSGDSIITLVDRVGGFVTYVEGMDKIGCKTKWVKSLIDIW